MNYFVAQVFRRWLDELDKKLSSSTLHMMAPSSRRNFKMHVTTYVQFCTYYNLDTFPADVLQECRYLQYLSEFHRSVDSSKGYISGMWALHEIFGFKPPPSDDYLYQLTINGIRYVKGHVVKQAAPMTLDILARICELVQFGDGQQFAHGPQYCQASICCSENLIWFLIQVKGSIL